MFGALRSFPLWAYLVWVSCWGWSGLWALPYCVVYLVRCPLSGGAFIQGPLSVGLGGRHSGVLCPDGCWVG